MKEIQAQLNDFKMRAENAEQVAQQAERRAAEAEKHLKVEKGNAATLIAEACRQLRREIDERTVFENTHAMMLDDFERHLPAGQGTNNGTMHVQQDHPQTLGTAERENVDDNDLSDDQGGLPPPIIHVQNYSQTPGPSSTTAERENMVDNDTSQSQGRFEMPVNSTRGRPPPRVGYFSHSASPY